MRFRTGNAASPRTTEPAAHGGEVAPVPIREVRHPEELRRLSLTGLSDPFDPFLDHFVTETLRSGGEVWLAEIGRRVSGVFLHHPLERVASAFTRDQRVAEAFFRLRDRVGVFSDFPLGPAPEVFHVYALDAPPGLAVPGYSHPVRAAEDRDRAALLRLLGELYGAIDERWLDPVVRAGEKCFVVEVGRELVGAAWVSTVPGYARLHSLSVRPGSRRMRVGTDLWNARVRWARYAGAGRVLSEISEHNVASRAIAVAGGMRPVGQLFLTLKA